MSYIFHFSAAVAACCLSPLVLAANKPTELGVVQVTATRTSQAVEDSITPVQVIDKAEIERSQARTLPDLLRGRAGINIANQGGTGKLSTLFIRGTGSDHVLVLIDGVRIGSAINSLAAIQDVPIDQIERIEIVRGPRSSLYGSDAIGGVIQIFTQQPKSGLQQNMRIGFGSHNLHEASAGFSYRGQRGWLSAQGSYQKTDGINACDGDEATFAGCSANEPDRDGYRNASLSVRGGLELTDTLNLQANFLNSNTLNAFDGSLWSGNETDGLQRIASGKLQWLPHERLDVSLQVARSWEYADNYYAQPYSAGRELINVFNTRRDSVALQGDYDLSATQVLTLGADWHKDSLGSTTAYDQVRRENTGVFVEYQGQFGAQRFQLSLRNDDNQQFGNHTTGGLGWGMALNHGIKLNASYGTGFKAPSFNDLYWPGFNNPNLEPEKSKSLDIGVGQYRDRWNWNFNLYETRVDNLISYNTAFELVNIEKTRIRGAELTASMTLADWHITPQLSYTDPRNRTANTQYDNLLPRRARGSARLDIDRNFGAFQLGATFSGAGYRYDDAANNVRLAGYATVDLRMGYAINPEWTLQARVTNIGNRDYETVRWYNQPGREYGVSLRYQSH